MHDTNIRYFFYGVKGAKTHNLEASPLPNVEITFLSHGWNNANVNFHLNQTWSQQISPILAWK